MNIVPAVIALVIFVGVMIYFFYPKVVINPSKNETFVINPTAKEIECNKVYQDCILANGTLESCNKKSQECLANTSVTTSTQTPAQKQLACERVYQDCFFNGGTPAVCGRKMNECLGVQTTTTTTPSNVSAPVSSEAQSTLTSNLNQLVSSLNVPGTTPTENNLALIQSGTITNPTPVTKDQILAAYQASQNIIKPHQGLPEYKANVSVAVPTDKGTLAEKIRSESIATPSIRQNIRQEIDDVVKDELNPYAVSYQMS